MSLSALPLALITALHGTADAAEVQFEGFYRARGRAFDGLSLARQGLDASLGNPEGSTVYAQHRLWLRPRFVLSDQVALYTEFRGLDNVLWGRDNAAYDPFVATLSPVFEYGLTAPLEADGDVDRANAALSGSGGLLDFTLWRAWGEVQTSVGRFTVGRVPLHWGLGIWLNDGVSVAPIFADHGDTTDRVMWEYVANDQVYVRAAIDIPAERLIGAADDTTSFNGAVAYRSEDITAGILVQFDRTNPERDGLDDFNMFTVDLATDITLGTLHVAAEGVAHFGGGTFDDGLGTVDGNLTAIGAALEAELDLDPFVAQLKGGFASGDDTRNDGAARTYGFDRDYSVGMFLFEQPMPTLADGTGARTFDQVRSGTTISNALFVAPTIRRRLAEGLDAHLTYVTARTASGVTPTNPEAAAVAGSNNATYGHEVQLGAQYRGIDHVELDARAGVFVPGSFYSRSYNFLTGVGPENVGAFSAPVFGAQLTGRIVF